MGVEIDGLENVFDELDELQDEFSGPVEDWIIGSNAEYASDVEFGTDPYTIQQPRGEPMRFKVNGQWASTYFVDHPGIDPQPYFRPAANEVRLQGPEGFIRHNTEKKIQDIDSSREFIRTLALAMERRIKELAPVDTGNLRASVAAVPVGDISDIPDMSEIVDQ